MNKKSLAGPRALTIIGSLAMLVSLVLPYATSSNDTMTAFTIAERWKEMQSVANMSVGVSEIILVMIIAIAIFTHLRPCRERHSDACLCRSRHTRIRLLQPELHTIRFIWLRFRRLPVLCGRHCSHRRIHLDDRNQTPQQSSHPQHVTGETVLTSGNRDRPSMFREK